MQHPNDVSPRHIWGTGRGGSERSLRSLSTDPWNARANSETRRPRLNCWEYCETQAECRPGQSDAHSLRQLPNMLRPNQLRAWLTRRTRTAEVTSTNVPQPSIRLRRPSRRLPARRLSLDNMSMNTSTIGNKMPLST